MEKIYNRFVLEGNAINCIRYGNGHINQTYLLVTDRPHCYILQKINHRVFRDVPALMQNIISVTDHLRKRDDDPRHVLTLVPTTGGAEYLSTEEGDFWRLYEFVTDSICLEKPESIHDMFQSGVAFGTFQNQLADFPAETLSETIPHFHDTPERYRQLREAVANDKTGRAKNAIAEIEFYLSHDCEVDELMKLCNSGEIPLRVTHNDTKLNNVMLDKRLRTPLCVIDLDTVMPGLAAHDFGDSIRFGASTTAEDERDLSKVSMSIELYEAYATGFLEACKNRLTKREIATFPMGAKLMTLECGSRFLADYLNGDVYFHIARSEHNLDRCRTQMVLVQDMERKWEQMQEIIQRAMV